SLLLLLDTPRTSLCPYTTLFRSTCLTTMLPVPGFVKLLLYHVAVNTVMLKAAIPVHGMREFVKAFFMLYGGGFLLGGIFSFFGRSEEHTSELQSRFDLVCRLLLE